MSEGHDEYSHPIPDAGRVLKLPETKPASEFVNGEIIPNPCLRESIVYFRENL